MFFYFVKFIVLIFLTITTLLEIEAKNYDIKTILCADTVGPRLEFYIPIFEKKDQESVFFIKFYEILDRESFVNIKGTIVRKKRQYNSKYYFYDAYFFSSKDELKKISFRFYPPSTLMINDPESSYNTLACWEI